MEFSSFSTIAALPYTLLPYYQFRNLMFICPKSLNFTNRGGERARNIAVKIQFMSDEGMKGMKVGNKWRYQFLAQLWNRGGGGILKFNVNKKKTHSFGLPLLTGHLWQIALR